MQKHVNLVDLVKSFPTTTYLQKPASIQPRTSLSKFEVICSLSFIRLRRPHVDPVLPLITPVSFCRRCVPFKPVRTKKTIDQKYVPRDFECLCFFSCSLLEVRTINCNKNSMNTEKEWLLSWLYCTLCFRLRSCTDNVLRPFS